MFLEHRPLRSDADLLTAHVAGDRYAFAELFGRHQSALYRLAASICQTVEDASDAVQDAMLAAHRAAPSFKHTAAVGSWLYRIVVNASLDRCRRAAARPTVPLVDSCPPTPDLADRMDTALDVRRALLRLPVEQRTAVIAVDMLGYSVADTAALLRVAEGTVKSRCARARARLARLLLHLGPPTAAFVS
jgi:RNA polymerase sigma-70 factor (ECF subfamily)